MRALLQRVASARVLVEGEEVAAIGAGLLVLLGVMEGDGDADLDYLARKCPELRIFRDEAGRMNRSVRDVAGEVLVVSQFTLAADTRRGRRPSFVAAAAPERAAAVVEAFCRRLESSGVGTRSGVFGADMRVELVNDGPVTIWIDSADRRAPRR